MLIEMGGPEGHWLSWTFWTTSVRGSLHFAAALIALILGPIIMFRRKGDKTHRWLGRIWAICMLCITVSALVMYDMLGRPNLFHFFAIVSLATLIPGVWSIRKYKKSRNPAHLLTHQYCMVWAFFGLAAAGLWQIIFTLVRTGQLSLSRSMLYNGLGALTAIAAIGVSLVLRRKYPHPKSKAGP